MKQNKLTVILIIIIILLLGYIIYSKFFESKNHENINNNNYEEVTLLDTISSDYLDIYLTSDGISYLSPINEEDIDKLEIGKNLKERLKTLYTRGFYYDIFINNYKLKGFRIELNEKIEKIRKIEVEENTYIIFIKENDTIGVFNYDEYYNLLNTKVEDNYNDLKNVLDVENNKIKYLDGSLKEFKKY